MEGMVWVGGQAREGPRFLQVTDLSGGNSARWGICCHASQEVFYIFHLGGPFQLVLSQYNMSILFIQLFSSFVTRTTLTL